MLDFVKILPLIKLINYRGKLDTYSIIKIDNSFYAIQRIYHSNITVVELCQLLDIKAAITPINIVNDIHKAFYVGHIDNIEYMFSNLTQIL